MTNQDIRRQRVKVFIAAAATSLCLGSVYSWSVFANQLKIENPGWSLSQITLIFSIMVFTYTITAIFAGMWQDKAGPRIVAVAGGSILGISMLISSYMVTLPGLYFFHGFLAGVGRGLSYATPLPTVLKWFPDRRGLAGGFIAGIFGVGGLVFSYIGGSIINRTSSVQSAFFWLGIIFLIVMLICARFLVNPVSPCSNEPNNSEGPISYADYTPIEMLKQPVFYIVLFIFILGAFPGLVLTSNAQIISQVIAGLSSAQALTVVGIISVVNGIGGPVFGFLYDKAGERKALAILFVILILAQFMLPKSHSLILFTVFASIVMMALGGLFGIFPSLMANFFGTKYLGTNYGLLFLGFGISAVISPRVAAFLADKARNAVLISGADNEFLKQALAAAFSKVFVIGIILCLLALALVFMIKKPAKKSF